MAQKKKSINLAALNEVTNKAAHIEQPTIKKANPKTEAYKLKNISVANSWIDAYDELSEPKLSFAAFGALAIKEKLEHEGIIEKKTK